MQHNKKSKNNKKKLTIKSFSELSKINRRELFDFDKRNSREVLKPLDRKFAVSFARQVAEGFDLDLHKTPSKYQYQKARKVITEWYDSLNSGKTKTIRPSKKNRKAYAQFADMPSNFKVYNMPVVLDDETFRYDPKKKKVIRKSKNLKTERYDWVDYGYEIDEVIEEPEIFTGKLIKHIEKDYKDRINSVHITVGRHATNATYSRDKVGEKINEFFNTYAEAHLFVKGLTVFSFEGQQARKPSKLRKKAKKNDYKNKK